MKVGMLFPGYGNQFVGMGKELYDNSRIVQEYFEEASNCLSINFVKLCFASSDLELSRVVHAYPALLLVSVSTAVMIKELGIPLNVVAGYGIGEYGALCSAEGINFPDGLYLISKLANFYTKIREQLNLKSVLVNGIASRKLNEICNDLSSGNNSVQIAVYENKFEYVVTGHPDTVDTLASVALNNGAKKVKEINTAEGFHTPLLNVLSDQLKLYLTKVDFKDLQIPLICNVDGKEILKAKKAQDVIIRQIINPIYWNNVLKQFFEIDIIIVPAPAKELVVEVQAYYPKKTVIGIDSPSHIDKLKELLRDGI